MLSNFFRLYVISSGRVRAILSCKPCELFARIITYCFGKTLRRPSQHDGNIAPPLGFPGPRGNSSYVTWIAALQLRVNTHPWDHTTWLKFIIALLNLYHTREYEIIVLMPRYISIFCNFFIRSYKILVKELPREIILIYEC